MLYLTDQPQSRVRQRSLAALAVAAILLTTLAVGTSVSADPGAGAKPPGAIKPDGCSAFDAGQLSARLEPATSGAVLVRLTYPDTWVCDGDMSISLVNVLPTAALERQTVNIRSVAREAREHGYFTSRRFTSRLACPTVRVAVGKRVTYLVDTDCADRTVECPFTPDVCAGAPLPDIEDFVPSPGGRDNAPVTVPLPV